MATDKNTVKLDDETVQLVRGCISGSNESQRKLFSRYKQKVYGIIIHNLSANYDVDDVLQQIFIKVFKSLKNFKGLSSLDTWVYRIATKVCIDQLRKKYRKRQLKIVDFPEGVNNSVDKDALSNPEMGLEEQELKVIVEAAMDRLSPNKRVVVSLYELEGFSVEEIANIIKKPEGTVKSRLFHGRKELAGHLDKYMKSVQK